MPLGDVWDVMKEQTVSVGALKSLGALFTTAPVTRPSRSLMMWSAMSTMRQWIETPESLQNIVLVGGGAFLFKKAVSAAFPKHRIHEVKEPLFANVRGFQIAGQNYAATAMVSARDRVQGDGA